jgi:hypothetical protein
MIDRQRIRLAGWLQQLWQQQGQAVPDVSYHWGLVASRWESLHRAYHRFQLAVKHGLGLCLPVLRQELLQTLSNLEDQITSLRSCFEEVPPDELSCRHWFEEVEQLYEEFNTVTFQPEEGTLRVETPVITLAGICLGAFAIDLKKEGHGLSIQRFEIEALQPEPAGTDSNLTHPHVKDGELCAGDAKTPIKAALLSGRLVDAMLLIQSTLQTYNSRSAYLRLDQWHGTPCSDCSRIITPDESLSCHSCDHDLCNQCYSACSSCSSIYCPECIQGCSSCKSSYCEACLESSERDGKPLCRNCRTSCGHCGQIVALEEIDEEEQVCLDCLDEPEEEHQSINPEEITTP